MLWIQPLVPSWWDEATIGSDVSKIQKKQFDKIVLGRKLRISTQHTSLLQQASGLHVDKHLAGSPASYVKDTNALAYCKIV